MIKKTNEEGFSLVELAVAAAVAVALGAVSVTVLSGVTTTISDKAVVARDTADCETHNMLAEYNISAGVCVL